MVQVATTTSLGPLRLNYISEYMTPTLHKLVIPNLEHLNSPHTLKTVWEGLSSRLWCTADQRRYKIHTQHLLLISKSTSIYNQINSKRYSNCVSEIFRVVFVCGNVWGKKCLNIVIVKVVRL